METPAPEQSPRELPILGGHLALDFANTVDDPLGPARHDHASTYPDVAAWAVRAGALSHDHASRLLGLAADDEPGAAAAVTRGQQLRAVLNETFGAVLDGPPDLPEHWIRLRPFVAAAVARASLDPGRSGAPQRVWTQVDDLDAFLHPVAAAAADLLVSDDLTRLRRCARCPWLFLDNSRNHSRRWCDMNDCGRAQKIERYVARRTARRRGST